MQASWLKTAFLGFGLAGCLTLSACASHDDGDDKQKIEDANEVTIPMDQAPAPVKDTLARESGGASVTSLEKESKHGKEVYEADAMINGNNYELKVAADGTLLSKKLDKEDDDKKGCDAKECKKDKD